MNWIRRALAYAAVPLVASCGGRSGLAESSPGASVPALDVSPAPDVLDAQVGDAQVDASVGDVVLDAGRAPAPPCHLVPSGLPARTVAFSQAAYSFHQDGLLLRAASTGEAPHVVQFGRVEGAGNDAWGDPALYAAEYDVSAWPPREAQPPTSISDAVEGPSDLVELAGGRLFFSWSLQAEYGGFGPPDVFSRIADGLPWQLGATQTLQRNAGGLSTPALGRAGDGFWASYTAYDVGDAGPDTAFPLLLGVYGELGWFDVAGSQAPSPPPLWSITTPGAPTYGSPDPSVLRTATDTLVVVAFGDCSGAVMSAFCEAHSLVVLRLIEGQGGGAPSLEKVASLPPQNQADVALSPVLVGDQAGHNWLTWWESPMTDAGPAGAQSLYAIALTDAGAPASPVESWFSSDLSISGSPSVGPLGVVYPVVTAAPGDSGDLWEVHLIHRQLDVVAPVEDVSFTTAQTANSVVPVQVAEPRALVLGYWTSSPGSSKGYGELARYVCGEDP
jgi:hypothetical protein